MVAEDQARQSAAAVAPTSFAEFDPRHQAEQAFKSYENAKAGSGRRSGVPLHVSGAGCSGRCRTRGCFVLRGPGCAGISQGILDRVRFLGDRLQSLRMHMPTRPSAGAHAGRGRWTMNGLVGLQAPGLRPASVTAVESLRQLHPPMAARMHRTVVSGNVTRPRCEDPRIFDLRT